MPCLMFRHGLVNVPGEKGPVVARDEGGAPYELFDVLDSVVGRFGRAYVVDLDGIQDNDPQLDYLQEMARDAEIWLDAGSRTADEAIDALVTGATRVVLSTSTLRGPAELDKAWKLSQEIAFEIETRGAVVDGAAPEWRDRLPLEVAREARADGPGEVILAPRDGAIDWEVVRALARAGPTWVGGIFESSETERLRWSGAVGGIFHLGGELLTTTEGSPWRTAASTPARGQDDET